MRKKLFSFLAMTICLTVLLSSSVVFAQDKTMDVLPQTEQTTNLTTEQVTEVVTIEDNDPNFTLLYEDIAVPFANICGNCEVGTLSQSTYAGLSKPQEVPCLKKPNLKDTRAETPYYIRYKCGHCGYGWSDYLYSTYGPVQCSH